MARLFLALLLVATSGLAGQLENARLLIDSGRFDDARQALEQARREPRLEGEALIMLTEICNAEEDFKCGIEHGDRAVEALPDSADSHYQYAVALRIKMSEVSKVKAMFALKPYKKELATAIMLDSKHVAARAEEVGFLINAPGFAGGDKERGRRRIEELKEIDWETGMSMLVELELLEEHPDRAIEIRRELVAADPDNTSHRTNLAFLLQGQERYKEADAEFTALTMSENQKVALSASYQRARTRILGGYDQQTAVNLLLAYVDTPEEQLEGLSPRWAGYWRLGNAYQQLGQPAKARAAYEEALRLDPDSDEVKKDLKSLRTKGG